MSPVIEPPAPVNVKSGSGASLDDDPVEPPDAVAVAGPPDRLEVATATAIAATTMIATTATTPTSGPRREVGGWAGGGAGLVSSVYPNVGSSRVASASAAAGWCTNHSAGSISSSSMSSGPSGVSTRSTRA